MKKVWKKVLVCLFVILLLTGCTQQSSTKNTEVGSKDKEGTGQIVAGDDGTNDDTNEDKSDSTQQMAEYKYYQPLNVIEDNYRIYYEVFLYSFCDSNGDGIGDINGLISKLDYINDGDPNTDRDLGLNGIWLMPIMPSTTYHKYDVTDYYSIDKEYGSIEDFKRLLEECNKRGIKVIIDYVMNHTSAKHLWFVEATDYLKNLKKGEEPSAKECPYVDYYNFVKGKPVDSGYARVGLTDWYYQCIFWDQMPDLNLASKAVRGEFEKNVDYWMDLGVDGFRLDAAKEYYSGQPSKNLEVLTWFANYVKGKDKSQYIVAEAWESLGSYTKYYQSGIDSCFDFAFSQADGKIATTLNGNGSANSAKSFGEALVTVQDVIKKNNENGIDAPFFTNHDTDRAAGYFKYDPIKIKLAGAMNLLMSGSSFVYYGEEIGMSGSGKDENKRAPMLWSVTDKTGMTTGPAAMDQVTSQFASVEEQQKDPMSIYNFYKMAIRLRNENPEIARGTVAMIDAIADESICAITKTYQDSQIILLYNLSSEEKQVTLSKSELAYVGIRGYLTTNGEPVTLDKETVTLPANSIAILK